MRLVLTLLILLLALPVSARDATDPYSDFRPQSDYNEDLEVPWVEIETQVKKMPRDEDLVEVQLDRLPAGMTLSLDMSNLTVDDRDRVIRTWMVARSPQGGYNGTFVGIRCADRHYKIYAYANPRRSQPLRTVEFPSWRAIRASDYRMELADDVLCSDARPLTAHQIRNTGRRTASDYISPY